MTVASSGKKNCLLGWGEQPFMHRLFMRGHLPFFTKPCDLQLFLPQVSCNTGERQSQKKSYGCPERAWKASSPRKRQGGPGKRPKRKAHGPRKRQRCSGKRPTRWLERKAARPACKRQGWIRKRQLGKRPERKAGKPRKREGWPGKRPERFLAS